VDVQLGGVEPDEPETADVHKLISQLQLIEAQAGDDMEKRARLRRNQSSRAKEVRTLMSSLSARDTPLGKGLPMESRTGFTGTCLGDANVPG
jgi:hypothetical protein